MSNNFTFQPIVGDSDKISAALGVSNAAKYGDNDVNKVVKLGVLNNYVPVAAGDDIEGIVIALEAYNVNSGFSFGTVQDGGAVVALVDNAVAVIPRDLVVAGTQLALGTAQDNPVCRKGTPTLIVWRVISLLGGNGASGTLVLIKRVK